MLIIILIWMIVLSLVVLGIYVHNPYEYPKQTFEINITNKRKSEPEDIIENWLCVKSNRNKVSVAKSDFNYEIEQEQAKAESAKLFPKQRMKQFLKMEDTNYEVKFIIFRSYSTGDVKIDYEYDCDFDWIEKKEKELEEKTGYSMNLKQMAIQSERRKLSPKLRKYIMKRDNYTCQMCGKYMPDEVGLQIDHIIPVAKGGKTTPDNLQVLCSKCNAKKSDKL